MDYMDYVDYVDYVAYTDYTDYTHYTDYTDYTVYTHWPVHEEISIHWPMHQHQNTVANAGRDVHTLPRAARPRTQCAVHNDLEDSGQGTKT